MNITDRTMHPVQQGTGPWLRLREGYCTASEAPAALGVSRYVTRAELMRRKHTGIAEEHSAATLGKFAAGHAAEAAARPLAEETVSGELFPITMTAIVDGLPLLASLDGLTLDEETAWESKLWNEELAAAVRSNALPEHYLVQMDQALLVTGAKRCLFTCTDGTRERFVWCFHERDEARFDALLAGWRQFLADLEGYTLPEAAPPAPVGKAPDTLPALRIEVTGQVTASNLAEFKQTALAAIRGVNRELTTDTHFADAEKAVKWCAEVEERLAAAKQHALSQTASIDALFKAIDDISAEARRVRLDLDKLVTRRKAEVKDAEVVKAREALALHVDLLNAEIAPAALRPLGVDFGAAIKGLKTLDSVRAKLDAALAQAKIEADAQAKGIRGNLAHLKAALAEQGLQLAQAVWLFPDANSLVHKAADDFSVAVAARIAQHKAAEAEKAERERVRMEAEARAKVEAEARAAEQRRQAEEAASAAAAQKAPVAAPPAAVPAPPPVVAALPVRQAAPPPRADEPATLKLGDINALLAPIKVDAAGLAELGIKPAKVEGASKLYRPQDFQVLCLALKQHADRVYIAYLNSRGEVAA